MFREGNVKYDSINVISAATRWSVFGIHMELGRITLILVVYKCCFASKA